MNIERTQVIKDLVPQATDVLLRTLQGKGIKAEIADFNANALKAYYSCAHINEEDLAKTKWLDDMYFTPMALCVGRAADQEGWKDVIICVTIEATEKGDCPCFNLIDRLTFENANAN